MPYLNQLEPDALIQDFLDFPPLAFNAWTLTDSTPVFSVEFNLLTTLEPALYHKISALPGYAIWGNWLKPYTCFVGATVSEYALLPQCVAPSLWVQNLKKALAKNYSFLIIKDIPQASPLLSAEENQAAQASMAQAQKAGFVLVEGQALAWVAIDFADTEEYLARLSKVSRKSLRRKLKSQQDLEISHVHTGDAIFNDAALLDEYYQLYMNVYEQSDIHFDILSPDFFKSLLQNATSGGVVMRYQYAGKLIGYNISFVVGDKLIDKYVGFVYPAAREHNLYFVSWFVNLNYALQYGLKFYVAGWTDPQVKKSLGAQFSLTSHAVYIRNPIVRNLLKPFKSLFERDARTLEAINQK